MFNLRKKGLERYWRTVALAVFLFVVPLMAFGQGFGNGREPISDWEIDDFWGLLDYLFQLLYTLFFALAAFFVLWAAFLYLTAAGDEDKIGKAKSILVYALIAVVIAVISLGFADVVAELVAGSLQ